MWGFVICCFFVVVGFFCVCVGFSSMGKKREALDAVKERELTGLKDVRKCVRAIKLM